MTGGHPALQYKDLWDKLLCDCWHEQQWYDFTKHLIFLIPQEITVMKLLP